MPYLKTHVLKIMAITLFIMCFIASMNILQANQVTGYVDHISGKTILKKADALNPVGSPFTRALYTEYKKLSGFEANAMSDFVDSNLFARKAIISAKGHVLPPESPNAWSLNIIAQEKFALQHARLMRSLDQGARELSPLEAAQAQSAYDCWIEQEEENKQPNMVSACQQTFLDKMTFLEKGLTKKTDYVGKFGDKSIETADVTQNYIVFFGNGQSSLNSQSQQVLNNIVKDILQTPIQQVSLKGTTDTTGSRAANMRLSQNRAENVAAYLIRQGVNPAFVKIEAFGEQNTRIKTPDGVQEPANRAVEIAILR